MNPLLALGLIVLGIYLGSCLLYPYTRCRWCAGKTKKTDGRGNYRLRRPCWRCGGKPLPRFATSLVLLMFGGGR